MRSYKSFSLLLVFFISLGIAFSQEGSFPGREMFPKDWYRIPISNSSFEEGEGSYPSDWDRWGKGEFFWSEEAYDGKRSAGLRKTDWSTGWRSQSFPVFADYQNDYTWFYCEAYLRTKGASGRIFLSIAWYGEKGWLGNSRSPYFVNPDSEGWEPIFLYALPPKGATRGEIILRVDKEITGIILFDAVRLYSLSFPISSSVEDDIASPYYAFISEYPGSPLAFEAYLQIALAEEDKNNYARAREIYQTMGDIYSPFKPWALFRQVECSIKMKDYKKAKEIAEKVGKDFPSFKGEANYWLSEICKEEGNYGESLAKIRRAYEESLLYAQEALEVAKKGDWFLSRAKLNEVYALEHLGRFEEAKNIYEELTEKHLDQRPLALLGVGGCYFQLARFTDSLKAFQRVVKEYPEMEDFCAEAYYLTARIWVYSGDYRRAIECYKTIVEKYPENENFILNALFELPYCYECLYDFESALKEYERSMERFPRYYDQIAPLALLRIGHCYLQLGKIGKAVEVWASILDKYPGGSYLRGTIDLVKMIELYKDMPQEMPKFVEFTPPSKPKPMLVGPMSAADRVAMAPQKRGKLLIVYGTQGSELDNKVMEAVARERKKERKELLDVDLEIKKDVDVSDEDIRDRHLLIIGNPSCNSLLGKMRDNLPLKIEGDALVAGDRKYIGSKVGALLTIPNPLNPENYVFIELAVSPKDFFPSFKAVPCWNVDYAILEATEPSNRLLEEGFFIKPNPRSWKVLSKSGGLM